jgi:hypothetical protein
MNCEEISGRRLPRSLARPRHASRPDRRRVCKRRKKPRGDAALLAQLAHQLRGGASQLGAERMTSLAGELETMARHGAVDGAAALVARLQDAFIETQAALRALGVTLAGDTGT